MSVLQSAVQEQQWIEALGDIDASTILDTLAQISSASGFGSVGLPVVREVLRVCSEEAPEAVKALAFSTAAKLLAPGKCDQAVGRALGVQALSELAEPAGPSSALAALNILFQEPRSLLAEHWARGSLPTAIKAVFNPEGTLTQAAVRSRAIEVTLHLVAHGWDAWDPELREEVGQYDVAGGSAQDYCSFADGLAAEEHQRVLARKAMLECLSLVLDQGFASPSHTVLSATASGVASLLWADAWHSGLRLSLMGSTGDDDRCQTADSELTWSPLSLSDSLTHGLSPWRKGLRDVVLSKIGGLATPLSARVFAIPQPFRIGMVRMLSLFAHLALVESIQDATASQLSPPLLVRVPALPAALDPVLPSVAESIIVDCLPQLLRKSTHGVLSVTLVDCLTSLWTAHCTPSRRAVLTSLIETHSLDVVLQAEAIDSRDIAVLTPSAHIATAFPGSKAPPTSHLLPALRSQRARQIGDAVGSLLSATADSTVSSSPLLLETALARAVSSSVFLSSSQLVHIWPRLVLQIGTMPSRSSWGPCLARLSAVLVSSLLFEFPDLDDLAACSKHVTTAIHGVLEPLQRGLYGLHGGPGSAGPQGVFGGGSGTTALSLVHASPVLVAMTVRALAHSLALVAPSPVQVLSSGLPLEGTAWVQQPHQMTRWSTAWLAASSALLTFATINIPFSLLGSKFAPPEVSKKLATEGTGAASRRSSSAMELRGVSADSSLLASRITKQFVGSGEVPTTETASAAWAQATCWVRVFRLVVQVALRCNRKSLHTHLVSDPSSWTSGHRLPCTPEVSSLTPSLEPFVPPIEATETASAALSRVLAVCGVPPIPVATVLLEEDLAAITVHQAWVHHSSRLFSTAWAVGDDGRWMSDSGPMGLAPSAANAGLPLPPLALVASQFPVGMSGSASRMSFENFPRASAARLLHPAWSHFFARSAAFLSGCASRMDSLDVASLANKTSSLLLDLIGASELGELVESSGSKWISPDVLASISELCAASAVGGKLMGIPGPHPGMACPSHSRRVGKPLFSSVGSDSSARLRCLSAVYGPTMAHASSPLALASGRQMFRAGLVHLLALGTQPSEVPLAHLRSVCLCAVVFGSRVPAPARADACTALVASQQLCHEPVPPEVLSLLAQFGGNHGRALAATLHRISSSLFDRPPTLARQSPRETAVLMDLCHWSSSSEVLLPMLNALQLLELSPVPLSPHSRAALSLGASTDISSLLSRSLRTVLQVQSIGRATCLMESTRSALSLAVSTPMPEQLVEAAGQLFDPLHPQAMRPLLHSSWLRASQPDEQAHAALGICSHAASRLIPEDVDSWRARAEVMSAPSDPFAIVLSHEWLPTLRESGVRPLRLRVVVTNATRSYVRQLRLRLATTGPVSPANGSTAGLLPVSTWVLDRATALATLSSAAATGSGDVARLGPSAPAMSSALGSLASHPVWTPWPQSLQGSLVSDTEFVVPSMLPPGGSVVWSPILHVSSASALRIRVELQAESAEAIMVPVAPSKAPEEGGADESRSDAGSEPELPDRETIDAAVTWEAVNGKRRGAIGANTMEFGADDEDYDADWSDHGALGCLAPTSSADHADIATVIANHARGASTPALPVWSGPGLAATSRRLPIAPVSTQDKRQAVFLTAGGANAMELPPDLPTRVLSPSKVVKAASKLGTSVSTLSAPDGVDSDDVGIDDGGSVSSHQSKRPKDAADTESVGGSSMASEVDSVGLGKAAGDDTVMVWRISFHSSAYSIPPFATLQPLPLESVPRESEGEFWGLWNRLRRHSFCRLARASTDWHSFPKGFGAPVPLLNLLGAWSVARSIRLDGPRPTNVLVDALDSLSAASTHTHDTLSTHGWGSGGWSMAPAMAHSALWEASRGDTHTIDLFNTPPIPSATAPARQLAEDLHKMRVSAAAEFIPSTSIGDVFQAQRGFLALAPGGSIVAALLTVTPIQFTPQGHGSVWQIQLEFAAESPPLLSSLEEHFPELWAAVVSPILVPFVTPASVVARQPRHPDCPLDGFLAAATLAACSTIDLEGLSVMVDREVPVAPAVLVPTASKLPPRRPWHSQHLDEGQHGDGFSGQAQRNSLGALTSASTASVLSSFQRQQALLTKVKDKLLTDAQLSFAPPDASATDRSWVQSCVGSSAYRAAFRFVGRDPSAGAPQAEATPPPPMAAHDPLGMFVTNGAVAPPPQTDPLGLFGPAPDSAPSSAATGKRLSLQPPPKLPHEGRTRSSSGSNAVVGVPPPLSPELLPVDEPESPPHSFDQPERPRPNRRQSAMSALGLHSLAANDAPAPISSNARQRAAARRRSAMPAPLRPVQKPTGLPPVPETHTSSSNGGEDDLADLFG
jgi:hypothetical protein